MEEGNGNSHYSVVDVYEILKNQENVFFKRRCWCPGVINEMRKLWVSPSRSWTDTWGAFMGLTELDPLHVGYSCVASSAYGTGIYPYCMSWLFGAPCLWCDALLSLDARRGAWSCINLMCQVSFTLLFFFSSTFFL